MEELQSLFKDYPHFLTSNHLVDIGLYPSIDAICLARLRGNSPDYIKLKGKVLYPKTSVIEFLEGRIKKGSANKLKNDEVLREEIFKCTGKECRCWIAFVGHTKELLAKANKDEDEKLASFIIDSFQSFKKKLLTKI